MLHIPELTTHNGRCDFSEDAGSSPTHGFFSNADAYYAPPA